jgi:hypothetical protein
MLALAACGLSLSAEPPSPDQEPLPKPDAAPRPILDASIEGDAAPSPVVRRAEFRVGNGKDSMYQPASSEVASFAKYASLKTTAFAGAGSIDVDETLDAAFVLGDLILIMSVFDASASLADPTVRSPLALADHAFGKYAVMEIVGITSASGRKVLEVRDKDDKKLPFEFRAPGTQIVRIPQFQRVIVDDGIVVRAPPWNGTTGGVIAFMAKEGVTNGGTFDANGAGFRGGAADSAQTATMCSLPDGKVTDGYAFKGEGPFSQYYATAQGAGTLAFGPAGAGGKCMGGGGGGGANQGEGGKGGGGGVAGAGGRKLGFTAMARDSALQGELVFGGGGGTGEGTGNAGARGGGVIFVRAKEIVGTTTSKGEWSAMGAASVAPMVDMGGGGGGGGGGYIDLRSAGELICNAARVNGGDGASGSPGAGSGGGGGGGMALLGSPNCIAAIAGGMGPMSAIDGESGYRQTVDPL